jgi:AcrR family transcriptional regulator
MADQDVRSPEKERQILDGAAAAFAQDGYEGASMSHIAAMAGVSKGTLYNYFDGKKELFSAFVQRECNQRLLLVFDELDSQAPAQAILLRVGRRILELMISETGLLTYRMVIAEAHKFPELAEAFHEAGPRRAMTRLSTLIRQMSQAGQLDVPDPVFAAEQLFALMTAGLVMRRRMGLVPSASEAEIDHVVQEAVKLFLRGYGI